MIVSREMDILKAKAEFDDMMAMIERAAKDGTRIELVEQDLWDRLLRLGLIALGGFVHAQGTGDLGPTLEYEGQRLIRLEELYIRRYVSIFGELLIQRTAYGTRPTQKLETSP